MTRGSEAPEAAISQNTQDEVRLRAQISASRMTLVTRWTLIVIKDTRFREKRAAAADASAPSRLKEQNSGTLLITAVFQYGVWAHLATK